MITPTPKMITLCLVFALLRPAATSQDSSTADGIPIARPRSEGLAQALIEDYGKLILEPEIGTHALPPQPVEYCTCQSCNGTGQVPGLLWGTNECPACSGAADRPAADEPTDKPVLTLVETSTSKSCPTCKDPSCDQDGTCKSRRLVERLARAEARRRLPSDGRCQSCNGTGQVPGLVRGTNPCKACNGTGRPGTGSLLQADHDLLQISQAFPLFQGFRLRRVHHHCSLCEGECPACGRQCDQEDPRPCACHSKDRCPVCKGTGRYDLRVVECMTCAWTSETPNEPHARECRNWKPSDNRCPACSGTGISLPPNWSPPVVHGGSSKYQYPPCDRCRGTGNVVRRTTADAREGRRLALPREPVLECDYCTWTSEKPEDPHDLGCSNREHCKACDDTGLEDCTEKDCTKKDNDKYHYCENPFATCTRPCRCVLVAAENSEFRTEQRRYIAERLARAEARRSQPADGRRSRDSPVSSSRPSSSASVSRETSADHPDGCRCRSCD